MYPINRYASTAITALLQRRMQAIWLCGIFLTLGVTVVTAAFLYDSNSVNLTEVVAESPKTPKSMLPVRVDDSASVLLLGTVVSNQIANVYPRREGIVEDIYVDIGDTVKKGQVMALLLPQGVEGQSAAQINEKRAQKMQAESDLAAAERVAEETVISAEQSIREKETELLVVQREQDALLREFAEAQANVAQMREQGFVAAKSARQLVEWVLLGNNSRAGATIRTEQIRRLLGAHDGANTARSSAANAFNALYSAELAYAGADDEGKMEQIIPLITLASKALSTASTVLQFTPTQPSGGDGIDLLSYDQQREQLEKITETQDTVYKAKEAFEDEWNILQKLVSSEPELYQAFVSGKVRGEKSNDVRMLEEQIRSARVALDLTQANQQDMVQGRRSMVNIADAMLQSTYVESGHREIRSPFSGIVSKRSIRVGEQVMPSMPAFELTNVPTALAKKAKTEIAFGLPEDLIGTVTLGDSLHFTLAANESVWHTATVTRVSPLVDTASRTVSVQAKVDGETPLPSNASIRVEIEKAPLPVYRVPSYAVKREGGANLLWILPDAQETPTTTNVEVLSEDGEFAEVYGNSISEETLVLLDPPELLQSLSPKER